MKDRIGLLTVNCTMKRIRKLFFVLSALSFCGNVSAQEVLPRITVKNFNGKIIVSWLNDYKEPVSNIIIQRSYDSLKNYTSIGTVLNPLNKENGYADANPPYTKMYYRLSISFEGGKYIITAPVRPVKDIIPAEEDEPEDVLTFRYPWQANPITDSSAGQINLPIKDSIKKAPPLIPQPEMPVIKKEPTYPSQRIFTARDNNVVIHLPDAVSKKYSVKFYDELNKFLFELTKLHEEYLILEKVNFIRAGWYYFELFEGDKSIEKNKFYIGKDGKNNDANKRPSSR